ncbi:hypothetical protein [Microbacterium sp. ZW T5_56]|uniref:hypothetical protein n=1 Tax=Microbacterium sp. ZW T5_56 TaxID=3378081 RepID=UPI003852711F
MAGEQNTDGTPPESGGYDGFAPMPLGQRSSEELGLGPSAPPVWPNGRPEYGGLPPYGTPYVPPVYAPPPGGAVPPGGVAPSAAPAAVPPSAVAPSGPVPGTSAPYASAPSAAPASAPASQPYASAPYAAQPLTGQPGYTPQPGYAPQPGYTPPPGYAAAPRAGGLPGWGWAVVVLVAVVIIVVVVGSAARILTASPAADPAPPGTSAVPTPGAPAPEGTVTLDMSANLPAGTVLAMAETADWAPYDTADPEHLLGPAAPEGEDAWRSPCYFALHSNPGSFGDDDRDGSEYWGELAKKYAAPGTTASSVASLLVPGPDGVLYEFSGYTEISTGDYEKASVSYTRVDVAGDRTYEIAVRCDGTEVPQDALDAVASQFQLK